MTIYRGTWRAFGDDLHVAHTTSRKAVMELSRPDREEYRACRAKLPTFKRHSFPPVMPLKLERWQGAGTVANVVELLDGRAVFRPV